MHHMAMPSHALLQTRILLNTSTNEGPLVNKLKKKKLFLMLVDATNDLKCWADARANS